MYYYRGTELYALRKGSFKAHFITELAYVEDPQRTVHNPPLLFKLDHYPSEKYDISSQHPDIIADIIEEAEKHKTNMVMGKDQLGGRILEKSYE
jgi:hypothetical protein